MRAGYDRAACLGTTTLRPGRFYAHLRHTFRYTKSIADSRWPSINLHTPQKTPPPLIVILEIQKI